MVAADRELEEPKGLLRWRVLLAANFVQSELARAEEPRERSQEVGVS